MTVRRVPSSQYDSISAALLAAQPGDTILVACGVYTESLTVSVDRVRIEGESPSCTILQGPDSGVGITILADAVTIRGLTVRNFNTGIDMIGERNVVRDNRVLNCGDGIQVSSGERNLIMGNIVTDTTNHAIVVGDAALNYIIANRISNAGNDGLFVGAGGNNLLIAENTITGAEFYGILVLGSGCWITNNVVQHTGESVLSISGERHYVHGNRLSSGRTNGMNADGGGHVVLFNKCNDNRGRDDSDGINHEADTSIFYSNEMSGNRKDGIEGSPIFGNANTLVANTARGNGRYGIFIANEDNRVLSNRVERNGFAGIRPAGGITDTIIDDNKATKNRGEGGIALIDSISDSAVRFNTACGNKPFDINVNPTNFANDNRIEMNRCDRSNPSQLCERGC